MKTFIQFLSEQANLHMIHAEDQVLYGGVKGTRQVINALRSMRDMLAGNAKSSVSVTAKWDGSPAVFCGYVPKGERDEGKFFVAKKGLFNKEPKYYTSEEQIDSDTSGDLANKLKICLREFPKVIKVGSDVFQGDLMFTASDIKSETIDNTKYLTFHPNTILYAVEDGTEAAKEVRNAKVGIVFHTRYRGSSFAEMRASFDVSAEKDFDSSRDVWLKDANIQNYSGSYTMTEAETREVTQALSNAGTVFQKIAGSTIRELESKPDLARLIEQFNNTFVRSNEPIGNTTGHAKRLVEWIRDKYQKEIDKRKTERGRITQQKKLDEILEFFSEQNMKNLVLMFDLQKAIVEAKNLIIRKLNNLNSTKTFLQTKNGYRVTDQEGYVIIDQLDNQAVKLVDRLEFSYANFSKDIIRGWEKV